MAVATADQLRARGEILVELEPGCTVACRRLSHERFRRQAAALGISADTEDLAHRRALIDHCVCAIARAPRIVPTDDGAGDALWIGELSFQERAEIFGHAFGLRRPGYLAPFVPSPPAVVDAMLALAEVRADDVVYDLGCGDGRIVIAAAQARGARGVGVDYDEGRIGAARAAAVAAGVDAAVTFVQSTVQAVDLSPATVVTLYLLPRSNLALLPQLRAQLKPGTRIVSHDFHMDAWPPERTVDVTDAVGRRHAIYRWTVGDVEHR